MSDELPNGCAVEAVSVAWKRLRDSGAPSRILHVLFADGVWHAATCFESPDGSFYAYDILRGSRHLPGTTFKWTATAIAQRAYGPLVVRAKWMGQAKTTGPNRRLSPAEIRSCPPNFDRLLRDRETR